MAKTDNLTDFLTGVADAIRTKKGTTAKINPQNFETEIGSITTSKPEQEKTVKATNSQQEISPDDGKILSRVIVEAAPLPVADNRMYNVIEKCLVDIKSKTLIIGCSDGTITPFDSAVVSIGDYAFYQCDQLKSISIPGNIKSIGDYTFYGCYTLTNVAISDSNHLTSIGKSSFSRCSSLTSITIPSSVISIGEWAFAYCSSLTSITMLPTTPPTLGSNVFPSNVTTITVPAGRGEAYKTADGWSAYADKIVEVTA